MIPVRLRVEFREVLVGFYLAEINDLFESEGIVLGALARPVSGQRRGLVETFYAGVDWNSDAACSKVIRVFEQVLSRTADETRERLVGALARDGYSEDTHGRIIAGATALEVTNLDLKDDVAVRLHLSRVNEAVDSRPEEAIGAAKDLVESASKFALEELGEELTGREDIPELVRKPNNRPQALA